MSNNEETSNKVVINQEDIKNIEDFFNHFRIEIPEFLSKELQVFKDNPAEYNYDKQCKLKSELAHTIVSSDHELFKDELFKNVLGNCNKEWFETQFNRDLESTFTEGDGKTED